MEEVGKAMALCFLKHKTQESGNYKFEFISEDSFGYTKINMYRNSELIASPSWVVCADHHLHPEKLYKRCEEWVGLIVASYFAKQMDSGLSAEELYEALSTKCIEEGICLDILTKHFKNIVETYNRKNKIMETKQFNGFASEEQYEAVLEAVKNSIDYVDLERFAVYCDVAYIIVYMDNFCVSLDSFGGHIVTFEPEGEPFVMGADIFAAVSQLCQAYEEIFDVFWENRV